MKSQKILLIILILLFNLNGFAQTKGISLIHKNSQYKIFLKEGRRIKIKTLDGEKVTGKFTITDNQTIMIKNNNIKLDSIIKIKKASRFSTVVIPISIVVGSALVAAGIVGAVALIGTGYSTLPIGFFGLPGMIAILVPISVNIYNVEKWEYKIQN